MAKAVYSADTGAVETLRFLRLNNIAKCNKEMGDVDLADQLRGNYRMDKNAHNRKWWWSIMFWYFGTMLTNSYVMHLSINIQYFGKKRKDLLAHLQFRERIAEYWTNPDKYSNEMKQNECKIS